MYPTPTPAHPGRRPYHKTGAAFLAAATVMAVAAPATAQDTSAPTGSGEQVIVIDTTGSRVGTDPTTTTVVVQPGGSTPTSTPAAADTSTTVPADLATMPLEERYHSLSGALVDFYATQAGMSITNFALANPNQIGAIFGVDSAAISGLLAELTAGTDADNDLEALSVGLDAQGLTLSASSLDELTGRLNQLPSSADARVMAAGADWAAKLTELRAPQLTMPGTPNVPGSALAQVSATQLSYGRLLNGAMTAMVADFPDLYSQVSATGIATPEFNKAWQTSMLRAYQSSSADFSSMLPDPCSAAMLSVMASGNPAAGKNVTGGKSCTPCVATGMYLHGQMSNFFGPTSGLILDRTGNDSGLSGAQFNQLPPWQRELILDSSPSLSNQLSTELTGGGCGAASGATTATLTTTLPGVFGALNR